MTAAAFRTWLIAPVVAFGLIACSSSNNTTPDGGSLVVSKATIAITSPAEGDTVAIDTSQQFDITYAVTNFTLQPRGSCGTAKNCGQVELLVDGYSCDPPSQDYNNISATNDVVAQLGTCMFGEGAHTITVELHYDDGSVVVGSGGAFVSQSIDITAAPPPPTLSITSPQDHGVAFMTNGSDQAVNIQFSYDHLTLESSPGNCGGDPACGMLILNIDDDNCDDTLNQPGPFNNFDDTAASPIAAKFGLCPTPAGAHTVTLSVLNDNFEPVMSDGQPLTASITVNTLATPTLAITSPAAGDTVTMGSDPGQSVPISFDITNLTLEPFPQEGTCAGNPACGVLLVNIDGDTCDNSDPSSGGPFNNAGDTASPTNAFFALCPVAAGQHTVTLTVFDDSGEGPLMINGAPLQTSVDITTQ